MGVSLLKDVVRSQLLRRLGLHVYRTSPHGYDDLADIGRTGAPVATVFDVGANVGQSALRFARAFPRARIHCFEPVATAFEALRGNVAHLPQVVCHRVALGPSCGQARIWLDDNNQKCSMVVHTDRTQEVEVETVDAAAARLKVDRIDLLKIDVEGYEMQVLAGATGALAGGRIGFVLAEVSFHPDDARHTLFDSVRGFLMPYGFRLLGIYDQALEWDGRLSLRFANALWCRPDALASPAGDP